jgi:hypothetical protein
MAVKLEEIVTILSAFPTSFLAALGLSSGTNQ